MSTSKPSRPLAYAHTKMAKFLTHQIDALKGEVSQRDIALKLGYARPNIISMFKSGEAMVPLAKVPALAEALCVDAAHLLRLGLEQYWPEKYKVIGEVLGPIFTSNEREIVTMIRAVTGGKDPRLTVEQVDVLRRVFAR